MPPPVTRRWTNSRDYPGAANRHIFILAPQTSAELENGRATRFIEPGGRDKSLNIHSLAELGKRIECVLVESIRFIQQDLLYCIACRTGDAVGLLVPCTEDHHEDSRARSDCFTR